MIQFGIFHIVNSANNNSDATTFVEQRKDIQQQAISELRKAQERQKKYYDKKPIDVSFQPGYFVFLTTTDLNLKHRW